MGDRKTWVAAGALALVCGCPSEEPPGAADESSTGSGGIQLTTVNDEGPRLDMGMTTIATGQTNPESQTEGCTEISVVVTPVIPTIVLLVDQSGSMTTDFAGVERWDALYGTLMGADGTVASLQSDVRFGLALYSSVDGNEGGECPILTEVAPALDNFAAIDAVFDPADPMDETPTGESLALVADDLAVFDEPGPKAIVLATDGEPDTCATPNPQDGQPEVLAAVQAAFDAEISTFVVSVGDEVGAGHLQDVANLGVGKEIDDPMPAPFYIALDAAELVDAFREIIGSFVSCELTIDGIVDLDAQCEGTVRLDGVEIPCGTDWEMQDASTIILLGGACETWKNGESHEIDANWPCGVVNIP
ncbi:MAG: VWA domain-containing protein [Deltaproteobacteria bacterium]|nr:VWA domain-containing protein [Nannocystaceae bacterium]